MPASSGGFGGLFRCLDERRSGDERGDRSAFAPPRIERVGLHLPRRVFVEAPTVVPLDLAKWCPLLQDSLPLLQTAQLDQPGEFLNAGDFLWSPPISGRALCAALFIFVLSALS